jgi:hypothetical protein
MKYGCWSVLCFFSLVFTSQSGLHAQEQCQGYLELGFGPGSIIAGQPFTIIFYATNEDGSPANGTAYASIGYSNSFGGAGGVNATIVNGQGSATTTLASAGIYTLYGEYQPSNPNCSPSEPSEPSFYVSPPGGPGANLLKGQYAFLFQGTTLINASGSNQIASVGSLTADGAGNITAGTIDTNSLEGVYEDLPVTGTYQLDTYGNGLLHIVSSQRSLDFSFFVPLAQLTTSVQSASLISTTGNVVFGNGVLQKQVSLNSSAVSGSYALTLKGETPEGGNGVAVSGALTFGEYNLVDAAVRASVQPIVATAGGYEGRSTAPNSTSARFTFTFPIQSGSTQLPADPLQPTDYVGYALDLTHLYILSLNPHSSFYLLSGTAWQ